MESRHEPALLMFDGGVASVVCAWLELTAAESDEHARLAGSASMSLTAKPGDKPGRDAKGKGAGRADGVERKGDGSSSLIPPAGPRLWVMTSRADGSAIPAGALQARAGVAKTLTGLGPMASAMAEVGLGREVGVRHALVSRLVEASYTAVGLGLKRVVWPLQLGGVDRPEGGVDESGVDLDGVADAWDKAVLVSRLASLDTPGVQIETPFLDLSDTELLELAVDLGAPVEASWVCLDEAAMGAGEPCGVCGGCLRWLPSVRGEGVVSVTTRSVGVDSIRPRRAEPPASGSV